MVREPLKAHDADATRSLVEVEQALATRAGHPEFGHGVPGVIRNGLAVAVPRHLAEVDHLLARAAQQLRDLVVLQGKAVPELFATF